uniref:Uncharacterized protein n=1 Tax=Arundo donax TaxID=35708 RepID=A0A0A8Y3N8_ARUDO
MMDNEGTPETLLHRTWNTPRNQA